MTTSSDVRFKIGGKTYDTGSVDQISLRDVVTFNSQAAEVGLGVTWSDIERISGEMAELTEKDDPHPDALVMFAVTVWAARRIAGEDISLGDALDVPMASIEIIEAKVPKDHQPKKVKKVKKSPRASALAAVPLADEESTTPPTSSPQSESA